MKPEQQDAIVAALTSAVSALRTVQAVLRTVEPDPAPAGPPPWWQGLGLDDPEGRA